MSSPICGSFKHSVGTEGIDKQTNWKCIWHRYQDKTKVKVLWQLIITFGTTNIVVHNGITSDPDIGYRWLGYSITFGIGNRDNHIITIGAVQK